MTVKENVRKLITEAWPTAIFLAANGKGLSGFRRDHEDFDEESIMTMLSFKGFVKRQNYETEDGAKKYLETFSPLPKRALLFELIVSFPDDEELDADGYEQVYALADYLERQGRFQDDEGAEYSVEITSVLPTEDPRFPEDVFTFNIEVS